MDVAKLLIWKCGQNPHTQITPTWQVNDTGETQNKQVRCGLSRECVRECTVPIHFLWQVIAQCGSFQTKDRGGCGLISGVCVCVYISHAHKTDNYFITQVIIQCSSGQTQNTQVGVGWIFAMCVCACVCTSPTHIKQTIHSLDRSHRLTSVSGETQHTERWSHW